MHAMATCHGLGLQRCHEQCGQLDELGSLCQPRFVPPQPDGTIKSAEARAAGRAVMAAEEELGMCDVGGPPGYFLPAGGDWEARWPWQLKARVQQRGQLQVVRATRVAVRLTCV